MVTTPSPFVLHQLSVVVVVCFKDVVVEDPVNAVVVVGDF